jgi:hypothetical protein
MHLVYRALEKEPVPSVLPPSLIPPSKRKKTVFPGAVPVLPASPPPKDSLRSTPSHGSVSSLNSAGSLSPKHAIKPTQVRALGRFGEQVCEQMFQKSIDYRDSEFPFFLFFKSGGLNLGLHTCKAGVLPLAPPPAPGAFLIAA